MKIITGLFILSLISTNAYAQHASHEDSFLFKASIFTMGGIAGGDVASTAAAAERGSYSGGKFKEANALMAPLFDNPTLLGLANGAASAGVIYTVVQWHRSESKFKRVSAKVMIPAWITFRGIVVYKNYKTLKDNPAVK